MHVCTYGCMRASTSFICTVTSRPKSVYNLPLPGVSPHHASYHCSIVTLWPLPAYLVNIKTAHPCCRNLLFTSHSVLQWCLQQHVQHLNVQSRDGEAQHRCERHPLELGIYICVCVFMLYNLYWVHGRTCCNTSVCIWLHDLMQNDLNAANVQNPPPQIAHYTSCQTHRRHSH